MPLRDLLPRAVHHFVPVVRFGAGKLSANFQPPDYFILCHPVPIKNKEFEGDVLEALVAGHVEEEGFVEDRVQCAFLDVGLFLGDALSIIQEVDLHVWVCKQEVDTA